MLPNKEGHKYNFNTEKSREQPMGLSLAKRRPHFPGQRPPQAPQGAEADRTAPGPVPRPPAHLRDPGAPERGGHQDGLGNAGSLLGGIHPGYLCPRDHPGPAAGGGHHGSGPGWGHLKTRKARQQTGKRRGARARKNRARAPYGSESGSPPCPQNGDCPKKLQKAKENHRFPAGKRWFYGCGRRT